MDWFSTISSVVSVIGTGLAIYQYATIKESEKRLHQLQYLLAAVHNVALAKQLSWQNQAFALSRNDDGQLDSIRVHLRARDDMAEMAGLAVALEGSIDIHSSAIVDMLGKALKQAEMNNKLQEEGLKNPTLPKKKE